MDRPILDTMQTFCMITNVGTFLNHPYVRAYPFHLTLCNQILSNGDYAESMSKFADRHDTRLILDNGAHEDELIDDDTYMNIITNLLPDVFVLPDLVGASAYASRCRSLKFAERFFRHAVPRMVADYRPQLMYTIQGDDPGDVLEELIWINAGGLRDFMAKWKWSRPVLGVGQVYLQYCFDADEKDTEIGRSRFFNHVNTADTGMLAQYEWHILGGRWTPMRIERIASHRRIVGLDSVKPLTCAFNGQTLVPGYIPAMRKIDLLSMDAPLDTQMYLDNIIHFCRAYNLCACPIDLDTNNPPVSA